MSGKRSSVRPDMAKLLAPAIAACLRAHPVGKDRVLLHVETTLDEVVDVVIVGGPRDAAHCVAEAAWALRLPENAFVRPHDTHEVSFP